MIDKYFSRPIFWDYFLAVAGIAVAFLMKYKGIVKLPKEEYVYSILSDLSTVSLTMVGFILTLVTVLISFKSSSKAEQASNPQQNSVFHEFFASALYFETIRHLKNGIKSLTLIALAGYTLKLTVDHIKYEVMFYFSFGAIVVILLTVGRSLFILNQVVKMQQS